MKEHTECNITISGYADKQTGNADINMRLSKKRAEKCSYPTERNGYRQPAYHCRLQR